MHIRPAIPARDSELGCARIVTPADRFPAVPRLSVHKCQARDAVRPFGRLVFCFFYFFRMPVSVLLRLFAAPFAVGVLTEFPGDEPGAFGAVEVAPKLFPVVP